MNIDKALNRAILERLRPIYPGAVDNAETLGIEHPDLAGHLWYLREHRLISFTEIPLLSTPLLRRIDAVAITARGRDFLEPDGGLTAELGMVTVRLDAESLRALASARVQASAAPADVKTRLLAAIHDAPAQALQTVARHLAEAALAGLPSAWQLIQNTLLPP